MTKLTVMMVLAALMTGCGLQNQINSLKHDVSETNTRIDTLQRELQYTVFAITGLQEQAIANQYRDARERKDRAEAIGRLQYELETLDNTTENTANDLRIQIAALQNQQLLAYTMQQAELNSVNATVAAMQAQANANQAAITALQLNVTVAGMIDPCGKSSSGYDEVLMRLSDGKVVAYFESGNSRHLSVLETGVRYQTGDLQACQFQVNAVGQISY